MAKFEWLDVNKARKPAFITSGIIILLSVVIAFVFGVKMDIQFTGGTIITFSYEGDIDLNSVQTKANEYLDVTSKVTFGESIGSQSIKTISVAIDTAEGLTPEAQSEFITAIEGDFKDYKLTTLESNNVAATTGVMFFWKCIVAVAIASVLLIVYVGFRFKKIGGWRAGVCGIVALLHDVFIAFAVMVIFRIQIDSNFIAAVLIILGYSINDTIIIYDRLRENRKIYGNKFDVAELTNISVRQTLGRTINTTITTLSSVIVICIVCSVYNITSIYSLIFPLLAGMLSGVYSTIFISCPLWVMWEQKRMKK
ncbi:MAG: protein translocase subunit SecF [Oscillospiraceae bacterium]